VEAVEILMEEHCLIERVLTALETAAGRVSAGEELRPAFFINAALFIKNFADGFHHKKEEGILFVAMTPPGAPVTGGPVAVMLKEHEQGRDFTREMRLAAEHWEKGDLSARNAVVQNALGYVQLLRPHIYKEDNILFPMAERLIPPEKQAQVALEFERLAQEEFGAGFREKYQALAEVLEKESLRRI
jgi:hemerythrin-like domain-containing protein